MGVIEVVFHDVPRNGCDGDRSSCLGVIEVIVLDVFVSCSTLEADEFVRVGQGILKERLTEVYCPPDRMLVISRAIDGFSATQRTCIGPRTSHAVVLTKRTDPQQ